MVCLYILPIEEAALLSEEYCRGIFPERMDRAQRFRFREDRLRCIAAGALLHGLLGIRETDISRNRYGKPYCSIPVSMPVEAYTVTDFSISHSGKYSILAVSDGPVGADIEDMSREPGNIASRVFLPDEREWLDGADADESRTGNYARRFYTLWTLKESIMKAEGMGLSMAPGSFSVLPLVTGTPVTAGGGKYYGQSFEYDTHIISLCSEKKENAAVRTVTARDCVRSS